MTERELQQIKERCNKATPGLWQWARNKGDEFDHLVGADDESVIDTHVETLDPYVIQWVSIEISEENADFIAHAREDISRLLAELCSYPQFEK